MNILYINTRARGGGAEKVAMQLCDGINRIEGFNTYYLAGRGAGSKNDEVKSIYSDKGVRNIINKGKTFLSNNARVHDRYALKKIVQAIKDNKIDIVHLHNIHGNYFGIKDMLEIQKCCKVIWTLHDMWALTGHCANPIKCKKWLNSQCENCCDLSLYPKMRIDIANKIYSVKKEVFSNSDIIFITPSVWLSEACKASFLENENVSVINNGVNIDTFKPLEKKRLKQKYGVSENRTVLMFVAANLDNPYKGVNTLLEALEKVKNKKKYEVLVVGKGDQLNLNTEYSIKKFGYIDKDSVMNELYNIADLFILPSKAENFPCSILESFAAGTPVAGSNVGGIPELVNERTGWLFEPENVEQLVHIIESLPNEHEKLAMMQTECRKAAVEYYSEDIMIDNYKKLYEEVLR
ncbi:MAG: glycosyltransferase [Candidatus Choladocola sp.]|nr:glycosyltransferase [Candidatus Choladocola sp.]